MRYTKKAMSMGVIAVMAMMILVGFNGVAGDGDCDTEKTVDLMAGQHIDAGDVYITHDLTNLYITITADDPWYISEYHVAVGDDLSVIPQTNKGSPKVGHFPYAGTFDPMVSEIELTIAFENIKVGFEWGDTLYIAVHVVVNKVCNDEVVQQETGWGDGEPFDKSWAMYIEYTPCRGKLLPAMPSEDVTFFVNTWSTSYFKTYVKFDESDTPLPSTIADSNTGDDYVEYVGWCVDNYGKIYTGSGHKYTATLVSSYGDLPDDFWTDDDAKDRFLNIDWDMINWILNNDDGYSSGVIQNAIWHFTDGLTVTGAALTLVNAAIANGEDFFPEPGEVFAVFLYVEYMFDSTRPVQLTIIEVDP